MSTPSGRVVSEGRATYTWLIELFSPIESIEGCAVLGNSLGFYVKEVIQNVEVVTTPDAWQAKRFSKEEAQALAPTLLSKSGVWRAIEHGFYGG